MTSVTSANVGESSAAKTQLSLQLLLSASGGRSADGASPGSAL